MTPFIEFAEFDCLYAVNKRAAVAQWFLEKFSEKRIRKSLRGHWEEAISSAFEIEVRDNLDYLLAAYGVMEIVDQMSGDDDWHAAANADASSILSHPLVRRYYEYTYPIVLPQLARARHAGELPGKYLSAKRGADVAASLIALIELDQRRLHDHSLEMFLGLLDGYDWDGWFIDDVVKELSNTDKVSRALARDLSKQPGASPSQLMGFLQGLDAFLRYAEDLHTLLSRHAGTLASSLIWLYHGYFYGESAESVQLTIARVRRLLTQLAKGEANQAIVAERAAHMDKVFDDLAARGRWLKPAIQSGLEPYLATLDS